ncbi:unnamed protein product [Gongylonema pulchrum]|uniref:COP9 signalosome complex subunit 4 n=1 Tax=Gongylonema pulchrum TaxID=637853 RepID=A0A183EQE1_9BILA|nr:unnamed protein product [Gongylonema pulchrum]
MVYALASAGQYEKARSVIEVRFVKNLDQNSAADNVLLANTLRIAYVLAKVERCNDDGDVFEILNGISSGSDLPEEYAMPAYEILFALARRANSASIEKVRFFFIRICSTDRSRMRAVLTKEFPSAIRKQQNLPDIVRMCLVFQKCHLLKSRMRAVLTKEFPSAIRKQQNLPDIVRMCLVFQKCRLLKHPLRDCLRDVASTFPEHFHELFGLYRGTEDFAAIQERPHLQLPVAVQHYNEVIIPFVC